MALLTIRRRTYCENIVPLKLTALEDTKFTFTLNQTVANYKYLEYSEDDGLTWVRTENTASTVTIETSVVTAGNSVLVRGLGYIIGYNGVPTISSDGSFSASGDVVALLGNPTITSRNTSGFSNLFRGSKILDASNLRLPFTMQDSIFRAMFYDCTLLEKPPHLHHIHHLANNCFFAMFRGCTALKEVPTLPVMILAQNCYQQMFQDCKNIESAELPATELVVGCYSHMFQYCTKLKYIKCMALTDISSSTSYTSYWVFGITTSGTFVKNSAATWENTFGRNCIPENFTVVTADS